ncbi:hypothetical protein A4H97_08380 [Niastella yeongjuensis]|uniref:Uncharacterized protein n=1 Tax=Niastella yeongjuensis TaxID=354355 RepID=A0A1V9EMX0_9BACT|nr:hypothetical protein [Niastella yeongjuensis]OQP47497.1 hypothetical protein A4H97_08380 [Niastella yeongjuensis]SEN86818.1 hypothetical protein SAMN05660816_01703 [Niastella yeongjuensis]
MIRKLVISIVFTLLIIVGYAQEKKPLTPQEALKYWRPPSWQKPTDSLIVDGSEAYNLHLNKFIDSLRIDGVDSVIVFSTQYIGYSSMNECDTGGSPIKTFIIWNKGGATSIRKIQGRCSIDVSRTSSEDLFGLYANNQAKLRKEYFMPVISKAWLNKYKTMDFLISWVDHEPNYSFFYKVGKDSRCLRFNESFLEDEQSMFHNYNLALKTYAWWKMVKKEVGQKD